MYPIIQKTLTFKLSVAIVCLSALSACSSDSNDGTVVSTPSQESTATQIVINNQSITLDLTENLKGCIAKGINYGLTEERATKMCKRDLGIK